MPRSEKKSTTTFCSFLKIKKIEFCKKNAFYAKTDIKRIFES